MRLDFGVFLFRVVVAVLVTPVVASATVIYPIRNHPDGAEIGTSVDADGYVLRLDTSDTVATFNANHTGLFFSWEPGEKTARIFGQVTHNESGDTDSFDMNDDVWNIGLVMDVDSNFREVLLTDEGETPWFDGHPANETYDDMFADLLADANFPDPGDERSAVFNDALARIYFKLIEFAMTPVDADPAYAGAREWNEFPNAPFEKQFFIQYRWRLWDTEFEDSSFDRLAAAGWLEEYPDGSGKPSGCCQDFLFTLGDRVVPEPGSAALLGTAIVLLGVVRRRRQGR